MGTEDKWRIVVMLREENIDEKEFGASSVAMTRVMVVVVKRKKVKGNGAGVRE